MTNFQKVAESLCWKKGDEYCSRKLGMSLEEYQEIKRAVKKIKTEEIEVESLLVDAETTHAYTEDFVSGTAEYKIQTNSYPRSSKEIEELVNLDKSKWRILKYSVRNGSKPDVWLTTVQVGPLEKKVDYSEKFTKFIQEYKTTHSPISLTQYFESTKSGGCLLLNKQDAHLDKLDRLGDNDIIKRLSEIEFMTQSHVVKAYKACNLTDIVYVIGSDQFNAEFTGFTTKGTPQQNIVNYEDGFRLICDHEVSIINMLLQYAPNVQVIILGGNHDQYVSWHMGMWLSAYYKNQPGLSIDISSKFNKYFRYDNTAVMLNHGDVQKPEKLAQTFPIEFKQEWGMCDHYVICTGDKHTEHAKSIGGIKFYQIPALSKAKSMWDMKQGYTTTPAEMTSFLIEEGKGITEIYKDPM